MHNQSAFDEGVELQSLPLKIWRIIMEDTSANMFISLKA